MIIRKAHISDIELVYDLVNGYADDGILLPRTKLSLYENIQCLTVGAIDGKIMGTAGLHVLGRDLAEIRSLVVSNEAKGKGLGKQLVLHLIEEAAQLGVNRVFAMTYQVDFFKKCGFYLGDKNNLPEKVWKDCMTCPKLHNCDENALLIDVPNVKKEAPLY